MDFFVWGSARDVSVQTVKAVWWDRRVVFLLLAKYNRVNRTIEGIEEPVAGGEDCPPTVGALQLDPVPPSEIRVVDDDLRQLAEEVPVADEALVHA